MQQLSFKWPFKLLKRTAIVTSFLTSFVCIGFAIIILLKYNDKSVNTILGIIFLLLYCVFSFVYGYLLRESKQIFYDHEFLYIDQKDESKVKIPLKCITQIRRKLYFFYSISLIDDCHNENKIIVLISTNPTLSMPEKFQHLKQLSEAAKQDK